MTSLSLEITAVNPVYKNLPKEGDLFRVTQVVKSQDSIFGERVTVIFKSTTEEQVVTDMTLHKVERSLEEGWLGSQTEHPAKGEE